MDLLPAFFPVDAPVHFKFRGIDRNGVVIAATPGRVRVLSGGRIYLFRRFDRGGTETWRTDRWGNSTAQLAPGPLPLDAS